MNNKVIVNVMVPELGEVYNLFIPTNEYVAVVIKLITNIIRDVTGIDDFSSRQYVLVNKNTSIVYDLASIVRDTDIMNSSELILM